MRVARSHPSWALAPLLATLLVGGCAAPPHKSVLGTDPGASVPPETHSTVRAPSPGADDAISPGPAEGADRGAQIHALLQTARSLLGVPYRYGGESTRGFDCSGLVQSVFARYGVELPRSCAAQAHSGAPVERTQLAAGDLVFFGRASGAPTHVGIYEGNQRFIHASTGKGRVRRDSLKESWFARHFRGARRISLP